MAQMMQDKVAVVTGAGGGIGQANYGAAKLGITRTIENDRHGHGALSGALQLHRDGGWTAQSIAEHAIPAMRAGFYALDRSQDVFTWDPV